MADEKDKVSYVPPFGTRYSGMHGTGWLGELAGPRRAETSQEAGRDATATRARALLAEALRTENALYDASTGRTLIPDIANGGRLYGVQVAETALGSLVKSGLDGNPADAMAYALENYPAPAAFGGMGFIPEYADDVITIDLTAENPIPTESTSMAQVLEILSEPGDHNWCLSDPTSISEAIGGKDWTLFGPQDLICHGIALDKVPDLIALLDECNTQMWDQVSDWDLQEGALQGALGKLGLKADGLALDDPRAQSSGKPDPTQVGKAARAAAASFINSADVGIDAARKK